MSEESILTRMERSGLPTPRVQLPGGERPPAADEASRYRILGEVARGAVGVVLQGHDNDLGRDVAIKVLHERHLDNPELVQRFVEEAQIGGQLQHPGVVPVYELGLQADNRPFFAMKLVKGQTLARRLAARGSPEEARRELLTVFRDICRTMSYVHSRGVIHRDLKPGNVMIGGFGEVQIVDWGFAKILGSGGVADELLRRRAERNITMITTVRSKDAGSASLAGSVMGTPAYMPPEQALGRVDDLDERSDIFSLGAILCEILAGRPPYRGPADGLLADAAAARLDDAWRALDECGAPARLVALCRKCLAPLPKDRPASADELVEVVAGWLTEVEGHAHRAELERVAAEAEAESSRRSRQNTRRLSALVVLVLSVGIGALVHQRSEQGARERERLAAVAEVLEDVDRLRTAGEWDSAANAVERAGALGAEPARLDELRTEIAEAAAAQRVATEDREFLEKLEDIRAGWGGTPVDSGQTPLASSTLRDSAATDRAYAAAFAARFGTPAAAAPRMRASTLAMDFAANLAFWTWLRKVELHDDRWRELAALTESVDPRRSEVFLALFADDPGALARAVGAQAAELDASLASLVGLALGEVDEHRDRAREIFEGSLRDHPDDFWLHLRYGQLALTDGEMATARRHFTVAQALQPERPTTLCLLSRTYFDAETGVAEDSERALVLLRRAVALAAENAEGLAFAGGQIANAGSRVEAEEVLRRAIELDPDCELAWQNLGITHIQLGRIEEGIADLRRALELNPESSMSESQIGYALLQLNRLEESEASLRKALESDPAQRSASVNLAQIFVRQNRHAEARALAEALLSGGVEQPAEAGALAVTLSQAGAKERALEVIELALAAGPQNPAVLSQAAFVHSSSGRSAEALRFIERAIELDPVKLSYRDTLLRVLIEAGQLARAVEEAERVLSLEPDRPLALTLCGKARLLQGDRQGARARLERAVLADPLQAYAWALLGEACFHSGDCAAAADAYRRSVELAPWDADGVLNLCASLAQCGQVLEAEQLTRDFLAEQPDDGSMHRLLAALLWHRGDRDEARREAEAALRHLADDPGLLLPLGQLLVAMDDWHGARQALLRAHAARGTTITPMLGMDLGGALSNLGYLPQAVEVLEEAVRGAPRLEYAHRYLGITLGKLGRAADAAQAWSKVVELGGSDTSARLSGAIGMFHAGDAESARRAFRSIPADDPQHATALRFGALLDAADTFARGGEFDLPPMQRANVASHLEARGDCETALMHFEIAFDQDPSLAASVNNGFRLRAASAAARVGGAASEQALEWVEGELEQLELLLDSQPTLAVTGLQHLLHAPGLARLRDADDRPEAARTLFDSARRMLEDIERGR